MGPTAAWFLNNAGWIVAGLALAGMVWLLFWDREREVRAARLLAEDRARRATMTDLREEKWEDGTGQ